MEATKKCAKDTRRILEAARDRRRHPTSKLARGRHSDRDVLASEAERCGQPSSPCTDIVQSRRVAQKDDAGPQRSDGVPTDAENHAVTGDLTEKQVLAASLLGVILKEQGVAVINTFQGGEATFASTRGALTPIDYLAAPAEMLSRLDLCRQNWNPTATGKDQTDTRQTFQLQQSLKHVPSNKKREKSACWTAGWKTPEVKGAIEKALEENMAKFDHIVDTEKMADATNDFFVNTDQT